MQFHQILVLISLAFISLSVLSHAQQRKHKRLSWAKHSSKPEAGGEVQREDKKNENRRPQQRRAPSRGKAASPLKSPFTPPVPVPTTKARTTTTTTTTTTTARRTTRRTRRPPPKPPVSWAKPPSPPKSIQTVTGSPFTPPPNAQQENLKPEMTPRKPKRVKKVQGKRPKPPPTPTKTSFLEALEARQRENADSVPPISSIVIGRGRTPKVNKGRRRGMSRPRPELVVYQDGRHRDIHEPGPGEKAWSRYTEPPPRQWTPSKANARCGFNHYSPRTQICCDGHVLRRQGVQPACCGGVAYDKVYGKCCDGQVSLGSETSC